MAKDARSAAIEILGRVDKNRETLDAAMDDIIARNPDFSRRDTAFVSALVFGVSRWRGHLDYIIGGFSKTPLDKIDPDIKNILRTGLFQIRFMDRVPESAAVNTSVDMAKKIAKPYITKFVNGLLRNIIRNSDKIRFPDIKTKPADAIAAEKSFPVWLVKRWINRFGVDETTKLCDAVNVIAPITIRVNTLKTDMNALFSSLEEDVKNIVKTPFSKDGVSFYSPGVPIFEMESFRQGWFQVQDEAAQIVSRLLAPQSSERILDACAGLGGKTGHISQIMKNEGEILAIDHEPVKLETLEREMQRLGASIVSTKTVDLYKPEGLAESLGTFDRILLDAPCSGLGVLRRNPDSKWRESKKNLNRYGDRQLLFLKNLSQLLKPSGRIVYAVCSGEPEENEAVIETFLKDSKNFIIETDIFSPSDPLAGLMSEKGYVKTFPHKHNMDGFFAVRLKRIK